jgi:transcriptional regulator with XRE-family HTH domain
MNTFKSTVNKLLQTKRYKLKREIAEDMGITPEVLSRYYTGTHTPSLSKAIEMFKGCGCDVKIIVK